MVDNVLDRDLRLISKALEKSGSAGYKTILEDMIEVLDWHRDKLTFGYSSVSFALHCALSLIWFDVMIEFDEAYLSGRQKKLIGRKKKNVLQTFYMKKGKESTPEGLELLGWYKMMISL